MQASYNCRESPQTIRNFIRQIAEAQWRAVTCPIVASGEEGCVIRFYDFLVLVCCLGSLPELFPTQSINLEMMNRLSFLNHTLTEARK